MSYSNQAVQLSLPLLSATFEELIIERNISVLQIIVSNRLKRGWYLKTSRTGLKSLVIPSFLNDAPLDIKNALIDWATLPSFKKNNSTYKESKKSLEQKVFDFLNDNGNLHQTHCKVKPDFLEKHTCGCRFDLREIFDSVNSDYFNKKVISLLRWVYNRPDTPRFALEAVMYHEMLHIVIPPKKIAGRNIIHGREFKEAEQKFRFYKEWRQWEINVLRNNFLNSRSHPKKKKKLLLKWFSK